LFDQKTGRPNGSSGLGDLFDHRISLLSNYHFERPGAYTVSLEQFNRRDTLQGVLAVGVRVELVGEE
jgi:gliding motility-associated lipoprotein GldH